MGEQTRTRHTARMAPRHPCLDEQLCCRLSEETAEAHGTEASSGAASGVQANDLQSQLERTRAKLAERDASAKKYKVTRQHQGPCEAIGWFMQSIVFAARASLQGIRAQRLPLMQAQVQARRVQTGC